VQPITFNARYSPELIDQATRAFRDYRFSRYGAIFVLACAANAVGLAAALWFSAKGNSHLPIALLAPIVLLVVGGPLWLLYQYFIAPSRQAARLKASLPPQLRVSVGPTTLWFTFENREFAVPWTRSKVFRTSTLVLFALSPFAFLFVPVSDLPSEADKLLPE